MNVFEAVKSSISTRDAAEAFGLKVRRNGMCCCPFHNDKRPSMKVDKRFHCFSCGADGDVIDFTAKLYNLSLKDAALRLADEFHISYEEWTPHRQKRWREERLKPRPKSPEQLYRETEHHFFQLISDYHHILKNWKDEYKPQSINEKWDEHFEEALEQIPVLEDIMDHFLAADRKEREEMFQDYKAYAQHASKRLKEIQDKELPQKPLNSRSSVLNMIRMPTKKQQKQTHKRAMCL